MTPLTPGHLADALTLAIAHEPVPADRVVSGSPTEGYTALGELGGCEIGVWEMSPGVAVDIEVDEVFVVVTGSARLEFESGPEPLDLTAGSVVRLSSGMKTTWSVHETLRKVYVAG